MKVRQTVFHDCLKIRPFVADFETVCTAPASQPPKKGDSGAERSFTNASTSFVDAPLAMIPVTRCKYTVQTNAFLLIYVSFVCYYPHIRFKSGLGFQKSTARDDGFIQMSNVKWSIGDRKDQESRN